MDGTWEAPLIENPACESAPGCGKWTPPMMPNPEFKGKWRAPLIDNPNYRGKWRPKKIPNPDYYFDPNPFHMSSIVCFLLSCLFVSFKLKIKDIPVLVHPTGSLHGNMGLGI